MERPAFCHVPDDFARQQHLNVQQQRGRSTSPAPQTFQPVPVCQERGRSPACRGTSPMPNRALTPSRLTPQFADEREAAQYYEEKQREQEAIVQQPYRNQQVIMPQPKVRHDYPTGSFLKVNCDGTLEPRTSPSVSPTPSRERTVPIMVEGRAQPIVNAEAAKVVQQALTPPISPVNVQRQRRAVTPIQAIPESQAIHEREVYAQEKGREVSAIAQQPYRNAAVITPQPKTLHDYPVGSFLKHLGDGSQTWKPTSRGTSPAPGTLGSTGSHVRQVPIQQLADAEHKLNQALHQLGADPNNTSVHNVYNTPIGLYSNANVAQSLAPFAAGQAKEQAPVQGQVHSPGQLSAPQQQARARSPAPGGPAASPSQIMLEQELGIPRPVHLTAAGPALPNTGIDKPLAQDITQSATYQLVQEMEIGRDHEAVKGVDYIVTSDMLEGKELPKQSQSLNALTFSLLSHPRV